MSHSRVHHITGWDCIAAAMLPPGHAVGGQFGFAGHGRHDQLSAAETVLLAECGADALQALRPHYSALVSLADLSAGNPPLRALLRHIGEMHARLQVAEVDAQRWCNRCGTVEANLQQMRSELDALQGYAAREKQKTDSLEAQLGAITRTHQRTEVEKQTLEGQLSAEIERCHAENWRLGAQSLAQSQALAAEQAAKVACSHEINRLRVELELSCGLCKYCRLHSRGCRHTCGLACCRLWRRARSKGRNWRLHFCHG